MPRFLIECKKHVYVWDCSVARVPKTDDEDEAGFEPQPPFDKHSTTGAHIEHGDHEPEVGSSGTEFGFRMRPIKAKSDG